MSAENSSQFNTNRFQNLWQRNLLPGRFDTGSEIFAQLDSSYAEPVRHYHTAGHINHCLQQFDSLKHELNNADAVELAIWFHDAVYIPGDPDNELKSAQLFSQLSSKIFDPDFSNTVSDLIMATLHREAFVSDSDTQYMLDIDLSSFALPWPEFLKDSERLRRELPEMADTDYYRNQIGFHLCLLDRPGFFMTPYFIENYQETARNNVADLIERLSK